MSWLDPVLSLLHNTNLHVQYQGQRLLQWFARHSDIAHPVIISLIGMLQTLPAKVGPLRVAAVLAVLPWRKEAGRL